MNEYLGMLLLAAVLLCLAATLTFAVRIIAALFSIRTFNQISKHPVIHIIWAGFALIGVLLFLSVLNPDLLPLQFLARRTQRAKVLARVESAGGWNTLRRDCIMFATQNTNGFYSRWRDTNGLPPAVIALKPALVEYRPSSGLVHIRIFGLHATGGQSTPYFGLDVAVTTNAVTYPPGTGYENGGVIGNRHSVANPVAAGIYEIY